MSWLIGLVVTVILSATGCSQNAFLESAKRDTDAALLFEAKKQMNGSRWTEAIETLRKMSPAGLADRSTKTILASAYAGRCGLDVIGLADQISSSNGASFFAMLLSTMRAANNSAITDCAEAETTLVSISSTPGNRSADENVMLAFIGFSKIGAVLATYADTNDDATPDAGFNSCSTSELPEAMLREVGSGITLSVTSLAAANSSIADSLTSAITSACTQLASVDPDYDFCAVTTPAGFTVDQLKAIGGLVRSQDNPGLGTCAGNLASCVCP